MKSAQKKITDAKASPKGNVTAFRPTMTLVLDRFSRQVVGFYISDAPPSDRDLEAMIQALPQDPPVVEVDHTPLDIMIVGGSHVEA